MMRLARVLVPILTFACLAGLDPGPADAAPVTLPTAVPQVTVTRHLSPPSSLNTSWKRIAKIGYGTAASKLGTSPGGDNLMIGPDYGVQVPNKTWWYLDAAKLRLAHYSDTGGYLGQVKISTKYLAQGIYFQWANPFALADGTVVLTSNGASPALLLLSPKKKLTKVNLPRFFGPVVTDGHSLYGFDEDGVPVRVKPRTGAMTTVSSFKGQGARSFSISAAGDHLTIKRPGVNLRINLIDPAHPTLAVHPAVEAVMAANGKLWILATGIAEISPGDAYDVVGLFSVSPSGSVSAIEPVRKLYSDSDPGSGHHLGIRQGSSRPTLMFIDTDAVRVYRKK